ncbi:unnamed protein product [Periconia digitata]|uniref:Uncharacterized protein n=1 Tax=Periconia digitata TaxID=1303443 RepID=A0A9W4U6H6_9PLEO|nr:unnamed protein product [Periconia digitata]
MSHFFKILKDPFDTTTHRRNNRAAEQINANDDFMGQDKEQEGNTSRPLPQQDRRPRLNPSSPLITDQGVPHPLAARNHNAYWNSVLSERDNSQYGHKSNNCLPKSYRGIVKRINRSSSQDRGKAVITTSHHHQSTNSNNLPITSHTTQESRKNMDTKPPPTAPPSSPTEEPRPLSNLDLYSHPSPVPHPNPSHPRPSTPTASIPFSSTSALIPTDAPILIYGSPGHRRRMLIRKYTPPPLSPHIIRFPTPSASFTSSRRSSAAISVHDQHERQRESGERVNREYEEREEDITTWNATLNAILESGFIDANLVHDIHSRARMATIVNDAVATHSASLPILETHNNAGQVDMRHVGVTPNFSWPMPKMALRSRRHQTPTVELAKTILLRSVNSGMRRRVNIGSQRMGMAMVARVKERIMVRVCISEI